MLCSVLFLCHRLVCTSWLPARAHSLSLAHLSIHGLINVSQRQQDMELVINTQTYTIFTAFIPLACAECDDSLPFSGASSIPLCYVLFPATFLHQLFFHPLSPHLAIYFVVNLLILLFPNSYIILFWEFYFLPFSVHAQTIIIYLTLLSLLQ